MPKVAVLVPASPSSAFFSQLAALAAALRSLPWSRWQCSIHACFGGDGELFGGPDWRRWSPHLRDINIIKVSEARFAKEGNWAQCDALLQMAPRQADVLLCLDADTFPVRGFEDVLDRVAADNLVAGVIAHFPVPPAAEPHDDWRRAADGLLTRPLDFTFAHSLMAADEPDARRKTPFYLNGGVVFYARSAFDAVLPRYLTYRPRLMERLEYHDFSGQVALALAVIEEGVGRWALPMRYNFPNDVAAEQLHPEELRQAVVFHYLRTELFDRHRIFASGEEYERFMQLPLDGSNAHFRNSVRAVLGSRFPFGGGQ